MDQERKELVFWGVARLGSAAYEGGVNGTCYGCKFASPPLRSDGTQADYEEVRNDPTEAYFRCSLPTRSPNAELVDWGEYAPCTPDEWIAWLVSLIKDA